MRYIGNKENIVEKINGILEANNIVGESFFDFFSGTASVAKFYKKKGYTIYSSDILYLSYCLQKAYIENNSFPTFSKLLPNLNSSASLHATPLEQVLFYLNNITDVEGFIYKNYTPSGTKNLLMPRMYFSDENGKRIDAIRQKIEEWNENDLLEKNEYYILIASLIETVSFYANIAGVYAAFYKKWDPRATKRLQLRGIELINNNRNNVVYNCDSLQLIDKIDVDILYLDPPYNARQYLPNYHLIETIAMYDNPTIKGVTGMRIDNEKRSTFCNAQKALNDLESIISTARFKHMVMSYNTEGIVPEYKITKLMQQYGNLRVEQFPYARFKSNNNGLSRTKKEVFEKLYILSK